MAHRDYGVPTCQFAARKQPRAFLRRFTMQEYRSGARVPHRTDGLKLHPAVYKKDRNALPLLSFLGEYRKCLAVPVPVEDIGTTTVPGLR